MGKDAFLRLLITQMQYQDPLDPVSDKEFVAQLAQFTALEQMQNMNRAISHQQAFAMIGMGVDGSAYSEAHGRFIDVRGFVDSVVVRGGEPFLIVGNHEMAMKDVRQVIDDHTQMRIWNSINSNIATSQNLALIGQNVQVITRNGDGEATGYVEGKVEFIRFVDGVPMLVIGDQEVHAGEVIAIAGTGNPMIVGLEVMLPNIRVESVVDGQTVIDTKTVRGLVTGINFSSGKIFVQVGEYQAEVDRLETLTEALRSVGRNVTAQLTSGEAPNQVVRNIAGTVNAVVISNGKVNVIVASTNDDGEEVRETVPFSDVRMVKN
jgi:flagellar basal-body rod modification protein FlgD